jgi:hypothetical protein
VIPDFESDRIIFQEIGRNSRAQKRAYEVHKGRIAPDEVIGADELIELLKRK